MSMATSLRKQSEYSPRQRAAALLIAARRAAESSAYSTFKAKYRDDPAAFARDCIRWREGEGPASYQAETLARLPVERRLAVRGPHGLGKTALASWAVLWFVLTRDGEDWKVPMTASAWRQLTRYLLPELRKWARRLDWERIGRAPFNERTEMLALNLRLETGEAFALASDNSELIEGAHASQLLYVFDESKAIPDATWDSAEGAMASGECYWLAISTPGEPQGRFYDIHRRKPGTEDWAVQHVTLAEAIEAGRVSADWAEGRKRLWGEQSAVYQNRVLGEFAAGDEDGVIPLAWVEKANERWDAWAEAGKPGEFVCVGADVARYGQDQTVLALRFGQAIDELRRYAREDTMQTAGRVEGVLAKHGGRAVVDVIGIGAGVVDRLRERGCNVEAFNASESASARDSSGELGFADKRSYAWWNLREMLDPAGGHDVALPPDDLLTGDLTAPHWRVMSGGRIRVESKDDVRKRLGRSTDSGDAVVQAFLPAPRPRPVAHSYQG